MAGRAGPRASQAKFSLLIKVIARRSILQEVKTSLSGEGTEVTPDKEVPICSINTDRQAALNGSYIGAIVIPLPVKSADMDRRTIRSVEVRAYHRMSLVAHVLALKRFRRAENFGVVHVTERSKWGKVKFPNQYSS